MTVVSRSKYLVVGGVKGVADSPLLGSLDRPLDELVVDRLLDHDAGSGAAALALKYKLFSALLSYEQLKNCFVPTLPQSGSLRRKHNVRWQHLCQMKDASFLASLGFSSKSKCIRLYPGLPPKIRLHQT